jgi:hypothetical protein
VFVQAEPNDVNTPTIKIDNGITLSTLFPNTGQDDDVEFIGRLGYRYGVLEAFIGTDDKADTFEVGFKVFSRDIAEPNSVKILSGVLANFINVDTMEIRGYSGAHRVMGLGDEDYSGALLGIEQKEKDSPLSLNVETQLNDNHTVQYYLGFTLKF